MLRHGFYIHSSAPEGVAGPMPKKRTVGKAAFDRSVVEPHGSRPAQTAPEDHISFEKRFLRLKGLQDRSSSGWLIAVEAVALKQSHEPILDIEVDTRL